MVRSGGNRSALLEAAIHCLQTRGYARTTARDLATAAGVNLGAITYHFPSKEALLNEALAESVRRWAAQQVAPAPDIGEALRSAAGAVAEHRWLAVAYVEAWAQAERSAQLRQQLATHYHDFRTGFAALAPAGTDAQGFGAILVALVDGLMVQLLLDDHVPDGERLAAGLLALATMMGTSSS